MKSVISVRPLMLLYATDQRYVSEEEAAIEQDPESESEDEFTLDSSSKSTPGDYSRVADTEQNRRNKPRKARKITK